MNNKPSIVSDTLNGARISRQLEIELPDKKIIIINKWASWDEYGDENDYEFDSIKDKEIFDALDEDTQDEILDILNQYQLKI